jgi:hypothetical protein
MIDLPDDFKNELIRNASRGGGTIKQQILIALCEKWSWPESRMPIDGRYKLLDPETIPPVRFNGKEPRGKLPLDSEGLPSFDEAFDRAEEAARLQAGAVGGKDEF